jgi:hypothetical protein
MIVFGGRPRGGRTLVSDFERSEATPFVRGVDVGERDRFARWGDRL